MSATKLPLTNDEKAKLRKAKVKIGELHTLPCDEIVQLMNVSEERATVIKALAEFQQIPSIGYKLAEDLVYHLNIYSLAEMKFQDGAQLFDKLEQRLGVRIDSCVEDQIRCVVNFANYPGSDRQWFDFTNERKEYREKMGFPDNRPMNI